MGPSIQLLPYSQISLCTFKSLRLHLWARCLTEISVKYKNICELQKYLWNELDATRAELHQAHFLKQKSCCRGTERGRQWRRFWGGERLLFLYCYSVFSLWRAQQLDDKHQVIMGGNGRIFGQVYSLGWNFWNDGSCCCSSCRKLLCNDWKGMLCCLLRQIGLR